MQELDKATQERVNQWLNGNYDKQTKEEIQSLVDNNAITELTSEEISVDNEEIDISSIHG